MAAEVAESSQAKSQDVRSALGVVARPEGVGSPKIFFGEDHTGDKSVWIIYPVTTTIQLTEKRLDALDEFAEQVRAQLRGLRLQEIPYIRFSETGRNAARVRPFRAS